MRQRYLRKGAAATHAEDDINKSGLRGFGCLFCLLLGGLPMQSKYRQHLGETVWLLGLLVAWWATRPFFFTPLPLVGVLVGSAYLACWLLGFGENTYSDK